MTDELGGAELHRKSLNPSEGTFGPHLDLGRLHCLGWGLGGPRFLAAAAATGPGATTRCEPKKAQERLNPKFASKSTSSEHRQFYKGTDTLQ